MYWGVKALVVGGTITGISTGTTIVHCTSIIAIGTVLLDQTIERVPYKTYDTVQYIVLHIVLAHLPSTSTVPVLLYQEPGSSV
jgi:hypothetical protein